MHLVVVAACPARRMPQGEAWLGEAAQHPVGGQEVAATQRCHLLLCWVVGQEGVAAHLQLHQHDKSDQLVKNTMAWQQGCLYKEGMGWSHTQLSNAHLKAICTDE